MDEMKTLKVKNKGGYTETILDDEDHEWAKNYSWLLIGRGYVARQVYSHSLEGKSYYKKPYLHREIMKAKQSQEIDHINGNILDNRKENLRFCTRGQNSLNKRPQKTRMGIPVSSIYKGVRKAHPSTGMRNKIWIASIRKDNKTIHLGYFSEEKEAAKAYNEAAKISHKEFAYFNRL